VNGVVRAKKQKKMKKGQKKLKKNLTEPTLLEITANVVNQDLWLKQSPPCCNQDLIGAPTRRFITP